MIFFTKETVSKLTIVPLTHLTLGLKLAGSPTILRLIVFASFLHNDKKIALQTTPHPKNDWANYPVHSRVVSNNPKNIKI